MWQCTKTLNRLYSAIPEVYIECTCGILGHVCTSICIFKYSTEETYWAYYCYRTNCIFNLFRMLLLRLRLLRNSKGFLHWNFRLFMCALIKFSLHKIVLALRVRRVNNTIRYNCSKRNVMLSRKTETDFVESVL